MLEASEKNPEQGEKEADRKRPGLSARDRGQWVGGEQERG